MDRPGSCLIGGKAIVSDDRLAVFDLLRSWPTNLSAVLCAFDLDGEDLRRLPIEQRKRTLAKPKPGIALNDTSRPCKLGCERLGST